MLRAAIVVNLVLGTPNLREEKRRRERVSGLFFNWKKLVCGDLQAIAIEKKVLALSAEYETKCERWGTQIYYCLSEQSEWRRRSSKHIQPYTLVVVYLTVVKAEVISIACWSCEIWTVNLAWWFFNVETKRTTKLAAKLCKIAWNRCLDSLFFVSFLILLRTITIACF